MNAKQQNGELLSTTLLGTQFPGGPFGEFPPADFGIVSNVDGKRAMEENVLYAARPFHTVRQVENLPPKCFFLSRGNGEGASFRLNDDDRSLHPMAMANADESGVLATEMIMSGILGFLTPQAR